MKETKVVWVLSGRVQTELLTPAVFNSREGAEAEMKSRYDSACAEARADSEARGIIFVGTDCKIAEPKAFVLTSDSCLEWIIQPCPVRE